jgi:hypothetical protein
VVSATAARFHIGFTDMSLHRNLVLQFYNGGDCGYDRRYAA